MAGHETVRPPSGTVGQPKGSGDLDTGKLTYRGHRVWLALLRCPVFTSPQSIPGNHQNKNHGKKDKKGRVATEQARGNAHHVLVAEKIFEIKGMDAHHTGENKLCAHRPANCIDFPLVTTGMPRGEGRSPATGCPRERLTAVSNGTCDTTTTSKRST